MKKLPFLFGIHCHQPVDNFYNVVDEAIEKSYKPFIETALKFKNFKFAVHFSGWLLEYLRQNNSDLFSKFQKLSENNQIEFFSGGFYEPVLAAISSDDRKGQINKLNSYIKNYFGKSPKGLWLTERVWDSSIIPDIAECGIEYVIVDDYHFISAGYDKSELYGYYTTEQDGYKLKIFPIDKNLRYMTPFKVPGDVMNYFKEINQKADFAMVFDDGEKFGIWPETYEWVYEKKWLDNFLTEIESSDFVVSSHFEEIAETKKPKGIAYLPVTSYFEMGEWSLFADKAETFDELSEFVKSSEYSGSAEYFIKGGIWKNFFAKYPESNRIHKRCVNISKQIRKLKNVPEEIIDDLYKAQCNDVLWHGIFGGLYLPNLRNNAYKYIIKAEKELDKLTKKSFPHTEKFDFDFDGYDEIFVKNEKFSGIFSSKDCGQLISFDIKDLEFNFLNTLSRHKEKYHSDMLKRNYTHPEEGISTIHDTFFNISDEEKELLVADWYNRNSFIDHITKNFNAEDFLKITFSEKGDFVNKPAKTVKFDNQSVEFTRKGGIFFSDKFDSELIKRFQIKNKGFDFQIRFNTDYDEELFYTLEMNFHFYDLKNVKINGETPSTEKSITDKSFIIEDNCLNSKILLKFETEVDLYSFLVSTVSQSEKGVDFTNQNICVLIPIKFTKAFDFKGTMEFTEK